MGDEAQAATVTVDEMREMDRVAMEEFHIPLGVMMENAGRACALLARDVAGVDRVLVLAGSGSNGGGGLAAARHLHNWGSEVDVALTKNQESFAGVPASQLRMLLDVGVVLHSGSSKPRLSEYETIIDAMVGYGLKGDLRGEAAKWARAANGSEVPVLSLDVPSGLNGDTGVPGDPCVAARWTLTIALPKVGLLAPEAEDVVGSLYLADIALPPEIYSVFGAERPPFGGRPYLSL